MAETSPRDKPPRPARRLSDLAGAALKDSFAQRGFASTELVLRWGEIAGADIARLCEPIRLQWPRGPNDAAEPATLILRAEGPAALEIQHRSAVLIERLNRFFGWSAIGRIAFRQAPLSARPQKRRPSRPDAATLEAARATLPPTADPALGEALARLKLALAQEAQVQSTGAIKQK